MSRTRYRFLDTDKPFFMTCTVVGWQPIFTRPDCVEIIFDSWKYLQTNERLQMFGYVVMENHLHWIADHPQLSDVVRRFKSYTARRIIDYLNQRKDEWMLDQLKFLKAAHKIESSFQFWQEGSHPQAILTGAMMEQKLDYIHNNPVRRGYVVEPEHWRYSSARNYAEIPALLDVVMD